MKHFIALVILVGALWAGSAGATHFRYGHITWQPTGTPNEVVFTVTNSFRRGYPGTASDGGLAVGDTFSETIGATALLFGDNTATPNAMRYKVDAINTVENWVVAHAIDPATGDRWRHQYPGSGKYTASIDSCCRTSTEINNPDGYYTVSTQVDLGITNSSPVSTVSPIVACPRGPCIFQLPGADSDGDSLSFRLSTAAEAGRGSFAQPGQGTASPLTVSATGLVTWDSSTFPIGLYSTSIMLEERRAGILVGYAMLDFLINTGEFLGHAPSIDSPPTPENGENIDVSGGSSLSFQVQCSDVDPGDLVTLTHLGLPDGATFRPTIAVGNPAVANFTWQPIFSTAQAVGFACQDLRGNRALPYSVSITVDGLEIPPGPDRDGDLFCDDMTINQLIASGLYNVIDNSLNLPATLVGTSARDLILAGGFGDRMFGNGGDDCIIGGIGDDYASGGDGADQMFGWNGADIMEGNNGADRLLGNDKNDILLGGPGNDFLDGEDNEDVLRGGIGADILYGGDDIDLLDGNSGNDQLFGELNDDVLNGGPGDDLIDGDMGDDVCVVDAADTTPAVGCVEFPPVSTAPSIATPIGDQVLDEAGTLVINIVATDINPPDNKDGLLSFSGLALPSFVTLTDNGDRTATLVIEPQPGDAGSYPGAIVRVDDNGEPKQGDIEVFDVTVTGGNEAPLLLNAVGSTIVTEDESLSIDIMADDPNPQDTLQFVATGLPGFVDLVNNGDRTATLDINPAPGDAGQYHGIQLLVVDNGIPQLNDDEIFSIIVLGEANSAPQLVNAIANQIVEEGQTLVVDLLASDPDAGDQLAFSTLNLPAFALLDDHQDGSGHLEFSPGAGHAGLYEGIVVSVTDSGLPALSDSQIFSLTVTTAVADADADSISDIADNCTLHPNPDQRDSNSDGYGNVCDPDLSNDGVVNFIDLGLMKQVFFTADADADLNGDAAVNFADLAVMKAFFFAAPGPSALAP